jgi:hypothetical protein
MLHSLLGLYSESHQGLGEMASSLKFDSSMGNTEVSSSIPGKDYLEHLKKINDVFYDQIKIADQKAAYIFTFMLAFMISSSEGRMAFQWQRYIEAQFPLVLFSGCMAVAATFTLVSAIVVVLPRRGLRSTSLFWGGWDANRTALIAAGERNDPTFLYQEYLGNIDTLSIIAKAKYHFVSLAFRGLIVLVISYVLLLIATGSR